MASTSSATPLFGWDILVKSIERELQTKEDVLLGFAHLALVNKGFRCIGLGESKTFDGNEPKSEALPEGWSEAQAIRYSFQGRLYNLKSTKIDTGIMINVLRVDERTTALVQLDNSAVTSVQPSNLERMIPTYPELADLIKKQLIDKVIVSKKTKETSCQTVSRSQQSQPDDWLRVRNPAPAFGGAPMRPARVGEIDVNPFGNPLPPLAIPPRIGGGMLFDPPGRPRYPGGPNLGVPPESLPPGARFDPFRPPDAPRAPPRRFGQDNDELPPPGYDDMFM